MKRRLIWLGAVAVAALCTTLLHSPRAHAVGTTGYFTGRPVNVTTGGLALPPCGGPSSFGHENGKCSLVSNVRDVDTYLQIVLACLQHQSTLGCDGTDLHQAGAAFLVETGLHGAGGDVVGSVAAGIAQANADFGTYANLLRNYRDRGLVQFVNDCSAFNSAIDESSHDAGFFQDQLVCEGVMRVNNLSGAAIYEVKLNCGNPFGQVFAIPPPAPQARIIVQTFTINGGQPQRGVPDPTIRGCVTLFVCAGRNNNYIFETTMIDNTYPVFVDGNLPASWTVQKTVCYGADVPRCDLGQTNTLSDHVFVGSNFTIVTFNFTKGPPPPPPKAFPWLQVHNGDVAAMGSIFGQALNASGNHPGARQFGSAAKEAQNIVIASLNPQSINHHKLFIVGDTNNPVSGLGSGANPTKTAVTNFCSSATNTQQAPFLPYQGSYNFGIRDNKDASDSQGCTSGVYIQNLLPEYLQKISSGGDEIIDNFDQALANSLDPNKGSYECIGNPAGISILNVNRPYFADTPNTTGGNLNNGDLEAQSSKKLRPYGLDGDCPSAWTLSGNKITGTNIFYGTATVRVHGDLEISGNLVDTYITRYNKPNLIPNLGILVDGNVIIDSNVTELDALIYATGTISTCSSYRDGSNGQNCNKQLVVHGGLLARGGFFFGRTFYNTSDPAGVPAEHIIGTSQAQFYLPPGFENRYGSSVSTPTILKEDLPVGQ